MVKYARSTYDLIEFDTEFKGVQAAVDRLSMTGTRDAITENMNVLFSGSGPGTFKYSVIVQCF